MNFPENYLTINQYAVTVCAGASNLLLGKLYIKSPSFGVSRRRGSQDDRKALGLSKSGSKLPLPVVLRMTSCGAFNANLEAFMTKTPIEQYHEIKDELDLAICSIGRSALATELTDIERIRVLMAKLQRCVIAARRHDYRQFRKQVKMRRAA